MASYIIAGFDVRSEDILYNSYDYSDYNDGYYMYVYGDEDYYVTCRPSDEEERSEYRDDSDYDDYGYSDYGCDEEERSEYRDDSDYGDYGYSDYCRDEEERSEYRDDSDNGDYGYSDYCRDEEERSEYRDDNDNGDYENNYWDYSDEDCSRSEYSGDDYRATSAEPCFTGDREEANTRARRAKKLEPRLLFTPSSTENINKKGEEFEKYFEEGVREMEANMTSEVKFQEKVDTPPEDKRESCRPDAIFIHVNGKKAAIVELKNYVKSPLETSDVDKTIKDMNAVKWAMKCSEVAGYMYVRQETKVSQKVEDYAEKNGITIMREGDIDPDKLAELIDSELNT